LTVTHATFAVERTYDQPPARVFAAWADADEKARWFAPPGEASTLAFELDFRVGGRALSRARVDGAVHTFDARYHDIVPDERIVFAYDMYLDDARISVSLATVELEPAGAGTRLVFTEHGAFFPGGDTPEQREQGWRELLDALAGAPVR
jgi:uncharacterized protein YndB with AHSA1/START domain